MIAFLLLLGCVLRLWAPGHMAVEHFDEGVYASNLWFGEEEGYQFPDRPLYAPPLVPFLIECSLLLFGPEGFSAMVPSLVAGCATIALVWWTARNWFGPMAAIASAALAATSEFHILYSRTALTDTMLCFWWLASVALAERAFRRTRYDLALAAGVCAGLAWWTKYNGWLTIGVSLGGAAGWLLLGRGDRKPSGRLALVGAILVAAAVALWMPVLIGLQSFPRGYGAVSENHAKYFVGLSGWLPSARAQGAALLALDGPWSLVGLALACFAGTVAGRWASVKSSLCEHQTNLAPGMRDAPGCGPGPWMLIVWIAGLTFAIPLYHPYPRLMLLWLIAVWLAVGGAIGWLIDRAKRKTSAAGSDIRGAWVAAGAAALLTALAAGWAGLKSGSGNSAWQPHSGLRTVAEKIVEDIVPPDASGRSAVLVYAEPALVFHLHAVQWDVKQRVLAAPAGNLAFREIPSGSNVYLAAGLHAGQSETFLAGLKQNERRFEPIREYTYLSSDLVLSDHFSPADWNEKRRQVVKLYRVQ